MTQNKTIALKRDLNTTMCRKLKEEARSLDMMLGIIIAFPIPITMLMYRLHVITAQQAGNMILGALFASVFFAMPVMLIHILSDCDKE
jgi:hypothetical protein